MTMTMLFEYAIEQLFLKPISYPFSVSGTPLGRVRSVVAATDIELSQCIEIAQQSPIVVAA